MKQHAAEAKARWCEATPQACQYLYFCTSKASKLSTCRVTQRRGLLQFQLQNRSKKNKISE